MGWHRIDSDKAPPSFQATRKLAQEWATMREVRQDRPVKERRLVAYRRAVLEKMFRPLTWSRAYCKETREHYRVNGKHTSIVFSGLTDAQLKGIFVSLEDYECSKLSDVARLYGTFDSPDQSRCLNDIIRSFTAGEDELKTLPARILNNAVGAIGWYERPTGPIKVSQADRAEKILDHIPCVNWLASMLPVDYHAEKHNTCNRMIRVSVMGVMMATYYRNVKDATAFWSAVRDGTAVGKEPPRLLDNVLRSSTAKHRSEARKLCVLSMRAWNAWNKSEQFNDRYTVESQPPKLA